MAAEAVAEPPTEQLEPPDAPPVKATEEKPAKQEKAKKKGAKEPAAAPAPAEGAPAIVAHPRAVRSIARAKSWGGLIGFALGGYLSLPTSTLVGAGLRALIAGTVGYVAVWGAAVFVWRRLIVLELKAREQQLLQRLQQAAGARDAP